MFFLRKLSFDFAYYTMILLSLHYFFFFVIVTFSNRTNTLYSVNSEYIIHLSVHSTVSQGNEILCALMVCLLNYNKESLSQTALEGPTISA
jgi:negative regulator of genetic competence, sporulation and motility